MRFLIALITFTIAMAEPALVGEWTTGSVSTIQYRDRATGVSAPPSGNRMTFRFFADGRYEQSGLLQFSMSNCTNSYFLSMTGNYTLTGDVLYMVPVDGTFDSKGNCGGGESRKRANKVPTEVRVRMQGAEMVMIDRDGKSSTYRRR